MSTLMMMTVHREAITRNDDEVNYMMMIVIQYVKYGINDDENHTNYNDMMIYMYSSGGSHENIEKEN